MSLYRVLKKDSYHMYALGEIIERVSSAEILGTYLYKNERGIMQRVADDQVELISDELLDTDEKAL